jgi:pyridoxamine 5'-phosphate oxidase
MSPEQFSPLQLEDLNPDPLEQFDRWFEVARTRGGDEIPEAACLSSIDDGGYPGGRIVLLKACDARGFVFYTNFRSAKGRSLKADPRAALTFYWEKLARQVRVQGDVERVSEAEADAYFATRPRGSQIGAWASDQSAVLVSREALLEQVVEISARHEGESIPRPAHWGGLRIVPHRVEFWQGMPDRLHDRFVYVRVGGAWRIERLQP